MFKGVCSREWQPYYGDPAKNTTVQNTGHIWGDPHIRFDNLSIISGVWFVSNDSDIIIEPNVWHSVDGIKSYKRCSDCDHWQAYFDSVNITTTIDESEDMITANVYVALKWYYHRQSCHVAGDDIYCNDLFKNTTERAVFTTTAKKPVVSDLLKSNSTAHIVYYNKTHAPITYIGVKTSNSTIITTYMYENHTAIKYHAIGVVQDDYVAFVNDTTVWEIDQGQSVLTRRGDAAVVIGRFNMSNLSIDVSTPYTTHQIDEYDFTTVESGKPQVGLLIRIMLILIVSVGAIIYVIGVLKRSL